MTHREWKDLRAAVARSRLAILREIDATGFALVDPYGARHLALCDMLEEGKISIEGLGSQYVVTLWQASHSRE